MRIASPLAPPADAPSYRPPSARARSAAPRLAYLVSEYPAVSHTFILREVRALRDRGFDIQVISIRPPDRGPERLGGEERREMQTTRYVLRSGPWPIVRAHLATLARRPRSYAAGLWSAIGWRRLDVRRAARDVCYFAEAVVVGDLMRRDGRAHLHTHFCSHVAHFVARVFDVGFSATVHGPTELDDRAYRGLAAHVSAAAFLCPTSRFARSALLLESPAREWEKIVAVELGVPTARYRPVRRSGPRDHVELLCVARLAAQKGHHVLLAAADELRRRGGAFRLHLVGDGPLREELEAEVARRRLGEHVVFHGALCADAVWDRYAEADAFVLSSLAEGMPVSLMEAMAMGLPCVATSVGGTPELVRDGVDGLLVPPADAPALADALHRLVDDARLRDGLAAAGRGRVVEAFDLDARVEQLADVLRRRVVPARAAAGRARATAAYGG